MKKLKKRIVLFIILIVLLIVMILKIYYFLIISKVYCKFKNFINEENRFFSVIEISEKERKRKFNIEEILKKNSELKYLKLNINGNNIVFELNNFENGEKYIWKDGKILDESELCVINEKIIFDISELINNSEKINLKNLLKIHRIKSIKYNDENCYEIIMKSGKIVVSKDTYLPIYMCKNREGIRSRQTMKIKYFYHFEVGTVTDENMQVP